MTRNTRKILVGLLLACAVVYGAGRLYFYVTAGFTLGNISSTLPYDPRWDIGTLPPEKKESVQTALSQVYTYLGKGCQSYVFLSADGKYVLKFFKYQRFRPQEWLSYFSFIPAVEAYRLEKIEKKKEKLTNLFTSLKVAYDELQPETGILYIHLNKTHDLGIHLAIVDKMGLTHHLDLDQYEFMLQKRADMLTSTLDKWMSSDQSEKAKLLIDELLDVISSEYQRGLGDSDHALMQNTGVLEGHPVHIDVGQFGRNEKFKETKVAKQELFNKTYKFRFWLKKHHPELSQHLEARLQTLIGPEMKTLKPQLKNMAGDEG